MRAAFLEEVSLQALTAIGLVALTAAGIACGGGDTSSTLGAGGASSTPAASSSRATDASSGATGGATTTGSAGGGGSAPHDTWSDYAQGFFQTYCVSCHDGSDPTGRDFRSYAIVVQNAATARCGVAATQQSGCGSSPAPKQFPIGDGLHPSDAERGRIVAWIDAGTPE